MRPLGQQTILVTGATDGHGRGLARELARRGATVLIHGRNQGRIDATVADIAEETGGDRPAGYLADLGSLAAVRRLADDVSTRGGLDALVNNAGIAPRVRTVSADGYELTFAVNYLAPFLLTYLVLPALRKRAHARIVNVASGAQAPVNFGDVMLEHGYRWEFAYAQSKFALIAFTFELAQRLRAGSGTRVTANALHPATLMPTKLVFESYGRTLDSVEKGVGATLWLVTDPKLDRVSGTFFNGRTEA
ncbi:MAG: SDR family NAD(P)-dependent oxidoreductase, partial [Solirubrobacterales bacterium]|nr:SDR family NAD(P)-dependent oxidoreductase [Solirubrobacterales bacterium]